MKPHPRNRNADILSHGAILVPDFITAAEEIRILDHIHKSPWISVLSRLVQHYGHIYDYRGGVSDQPAPPLPEWARHLARRLLPQFNGSLPVQCIVNEYRPGQGIGMHSDHRDFGPVVASISLAQDWPMRFRLPESAPYTPNGLPHDQVMVLPRRSALVLSGAARSRWMHGIDRADTSGFSQNRYSATFRTLAN